MQHQNRIRIRRIQGKKGLAGAAVVARFIGRYFDLEG